MLLGLSNSGISTFGVLALMNGYGQLFSTANIALTGYLASSAIGVLAGGFLATAPSAMARSRPVASASMR